MKLILLLPSRHQLRMLAVIWPLIWVIGCDISWPTAPDGAAAGAQPLTVEQESVDLGIVRVGDEVKQTFLLRVWGKSPVKVTKATTSCCHGKGLMPDLNGKIFEPGSQIEVSLSLRSRMPGAISVFAKIFCDGFEDPLQFSLSAAVVGTPIVSPNPVLVSITDDRPAEFVLNATLCRASTTEPLLFNVDRSQYGPFQISPGKVTSRPYRTFADQENPPIYDEVPLTVKFDSPTATAIGDQHFALSLAWGNEHDKTVVPVTIRRLPPIEPVVDRIFCGLLKANLNWSGEVKFRRHGIENQVMVKHVETTSPLVEAIVSEDGLSCMVRVKGDTQERGRQAASIFVEYSESRLPRREIPISWVVVDK